MPRPQTNSRLQEEHVSSVPRSLGGVEETHPAFGVAVVTRGSGTARSLFQSDVLHNETVTLSIQTASRARDLHHDWIHPGEQLVEVEMSLTQWGALVSSVGLGSGVPVTIRRTQSSNAVPMLPYQPRIKASLDEVHGSVARLFARAKETLTAVDEAFEGKKGVRAVRDALRLHRASISNAEGNAGFAVKSLVSAGEAVTSQVRADIESQILSAVRITYVPDAIKAPQIRLDEIETQSENGAQVDPSPH